MSTIKTNQLAHTANNAAIYTLPQTDGQAGQVLQTNGSGGLSWVSLPTPGITMVDQWRLNDHFDLTTSVQVVNTNWERNDNNGYTSIGTGMTESSGVFTFPSTGIYLVQMYVTAYGANGSTTGIHARIQGKKGSGSFADKSQASEAAHASQAYGSIANSFVWDCESTANDQIQLVGVGNNTGMKFLGSSTVQRTGFTFIRLGDT
tara:strand:- start:458 stop:1069 length:612 start_codon:yes stop_codon:yes gene_type:complete